MKRSLLLIPVITLIFCTFFGCAERNVLPAAKGSVTENVSVTESAGEKNTEDIKYSTAGELSFRRIINDECPERRRGEYAGYVIYVTNVSDHTIDLHDGDLKESLCCTVNGEKYSVSPTGYLANGENESNYLEPGEFKVCNTLFILPEDAPAGYYDAELELNGEVITFKNVVKTVE